MTAPLTFGYELEPMGPSLSAVACMLTQVRSRHARTNFLNTIECQCNDAVTAPQIFGRMRCAVAAHPFFDYDLIAMEGRTF